MIYFITEEYYVHGDEKEEAENSSSDDNRDTPYEPISDRSMKNLHDTITNKIARGRQLPS